MAARRCASLRMVWNRSSCALVRPDASKAFGGVFLPAARKIAAIVRIVSAGHADFVAVVDHRNAAGRQQKRERLFQLVRRRALPVQEARHVVEARGT